MYPDTPAAALSSIDSSTAIAPSAKAGGGRAKSTSDEIKAKRVGVFIPVATDRSQKEGSELKMMTAEKQ